MNAHNWQTRGPLKAVVLAAGKGKRLQSEANDAPKVLRRAAGKTLLGWALAHISFIPPADTIIVVGFQAERVRGAMGPAYTYAFQAQQLGTGHAVACARPLLEGFDGDTLVIYGDMPLVRQQTYQKLVQTHQASGADATLLTAITQTIPDYGRILRDASGAFRGIVEQRDATAEQLNLAEVNPGIYVFKNTHLFEVLKQLDNQNAQGEYYLTDVPALMLQGGYRVETVTIHDEQEILGVNTQADLDQCDRILSQRQS